MLIDASGCWSMYSTESCWHIHQNARDTLRLFCAVCSLFYAVVINARDSPPPPCLEQPHNPTNDTRSDSRGCSTITCGCFTSPILSDGELGNEPSSVNVTNNDCHWYFIIQSILFLFAHPHRHHPPHLLLHYPPYHPTPSCPALLLKHSNRDHVTLICIPIWSKVTIPTFVFRSGGNASDSVIGWLNALSKASPPSFYIPLRGLANEFELVVVHSA